MLRLIKILFGSDNKTLATKRGHATHRVDRSSRPRARKASDSYFDSMQRMQRAVSDRDFESAARHVHQNLRHMTGWVKESRSEYGSFDIPSIPALQQGGTVLALLGDDKGLARMQEIVASLDELEPWAETVEQHLGDRRLFADILKLVATQPNCLQTDVKGLIGEEDGRRVAKLISYLDKADKIVRVKSGRTYQLILADSPAIPAPPAKRIVRSHRTERKPPRLREIDVSSLGYVPLPRSPSEWGDANFSPELATVPDSVAPFEVRGADWKISAVRKLSPAQRPDTAFRRMHPTDSGLFMIDDLGNYAESRIMPSWTMGPPSSLLESM